MQSWTCGWVSQGLNTHDGMPGDFGRVCGESVSFARWLSFLAFRGCDCPMTAWLSDQSSLDRHVVLGEQCPDSIHISSTTSTLPDKTTANRYVSQRFATYAPLAALFLHLALLALSLAAYQKAKSSSSARAATPNSEDGEKLELEEYKNFPKDDKA